MPRAAVLYEYDTPLRVRSLTLRDPRDDEVVVRLAASGVCHTDLTVRSGALPLPPPCVLGHEGAGVVEAVGRAVRHLAPGDHVVLSWSANCGRCHYCVRGRSHLCEGVMDGFLRGDEYVFDDAGTRVARLAGVASFAERTVVRASAAIKIPVDVPLDRACLVGCAVMTGIGAAINTVSIEPGESVAVFGCGGVGLNVLQGARLRGASPIIAVDRVQAKLELARTFGATDVVLAGPEVDVVAALRDRTDGLGVDYAFEVIGSTAVVAQAFAACKRGGTTVVVGAPPVTDELRLPAASLPLEEKSVVGSLYGSANLGRDIPRLIDLYQRGAILLDELIEARIGLDDANEALDALARGEGARRVIIYD
jgi:S-(hydroxymethyl)glutathione dehydrogenase / alcohol dehydrogenase